MPESRLIRPLKKGNICERVLIQNCVIHSHRANGIRIGVGCGYIKNCTLNGLDVEAPNYAGFEINSKWSINSDSITKIENILCSNINIRARMAFDIISAFGDQKITEQCYIKNVVFDNMFLSQREISKIHGREDAPIINLIFRDILAFTDEMKNPSDDFFDVVGCDAVQFDNLKVIPGKQRLF